MKNVLLIEDDSVLRENTAELLELSGYNVITSDLFFKLEDMKFTMCLANPPYGSGGNLAIKFLNKLGDLTDDIRIIMPLSVRKPS